MADDNKPRWRKHAETTSPFELPALGSHDPAGPEDGPGPECPIDALAEALDEAYSFGRHGELEPDWALMANNLAAEIRRQGYMMAVKSLRTHGEKAPYPERTALLLVAAVLEVEAPGEPE